MNSVHLTVVPPNNSYRARQAAEQARLIEIVCGETELYMSALAEISGINASTLTRSVRLGIPNKPETILKLIDTYIKIRKGKGHPLNPKVMRYRSRLSGEKFEIDEPEKPVTSDLTAGKITSDRLTPERLKLAIAMTNDYYGLNLSDNGIDDLASEISELYPAIIAEEKRTGSLPTNDPEAWRQIRRVARRLGKS